MRCYYCGASLDFTDTCPECDADVRMWKKIHAISCRLYNEGLAKANVRDLSGAMESLKLSLRYDKMNMDARNLLGLIYYEMGETVKALSEWVISKSLIPEDNPAAEYLFDVQRSASQLENANETIKKFNQSLTYCQEENYDLAVIQLKKVLSLNPKLVKGHQLLALLYMREERYDLAMRALRHAEKIDARNTITMQYIRECKEHLRANGKLKPSKEEEETVTYQSGNDIIIRPAKFTDHTAIRTVINLIMGAAIGIAVVYFLIVPEIKQKANSAASAQVVEANQTISTREQTIKGLEEQIASMKQQVEDAESSVAAAEEKTAVYNQLLSAYVSYADQDYTSAGTKLAEVKRDLLDEGGQSIYDNMLTEVQSAMMSAAMNEGLSLYDAGDYNGSIPKFLEIAQTDPTYKDGEAVFYLAFAYNHVEDYPNALKWFKVSAETAGNADYRSTSSEIAADLVARGVTAAE